MTDLLDVNLLISLAWPNHVHHAAARAWFGARGGQAWATTPVTEAGFVRVSSNKSAISTAVTPGDARSLLGQIRDVDGHVFFPDDVELVTGSERVLAQRLVGYRQVTDAHLLAVARRHGARLATLDNAVRTLAGEDAGDVVVVPVPPIAAPASS
ncbi:MAG: PIN domain-containing protein [Actinobacteria bacterium]|nr:PIN domain-containing protein [Actinomycetota bacterium]MBO0830799.1 PIN domain-containing protein [Actinomycetota bacterium]MBO0834963.1 PIN domain-containing protein [Actinomycetota bacterium]